MPSILNTPANEIPIHLFCLPIAQLEILLINVLTDPIFSQAITIFHNYVLVQQLFAHLAVPHLPIQIAEAFNPALSTA